MSLGSCKLSPEFEFKIIFKSLNDLPLGTVFWVFVRYTG